jgi:hypothetical protein
MEGASQLSVTEVGGDTIAEMTEVLAKHSWGNKLVLLINSRFKDSLTMADMACVHRWMSSLGESIEIIWGVGAVMSNDAPFQMMVVMPVP